MSNNPFLKNLLLVEMKGGIRILTLNRPEKRNALNDELIIRAKIGFRRMPKPMNLLRVIVIRGAGKDFCSGADLSVDPKIATASYEENLEDARSLGELFKSIRRARVPVIAAVRGRALAGGCGLRYACDIVRLRQHWCFRFSRSKDRIRSRDGCRNCSAEYV